MKNKPRRPENKPAPAEITPPAPLTTTMIPTASAASTTPAPPAGAELPLGEFAALIGLDWGDTEHAIALAVRGAARAEELTLPHSAESLHAWLGELRERFSGQPVAVAVEASKGAVVAALLEHQTWLTVFPIHPATSRRMSTAFTPSGAKDDLPDARTLLEILQHYRGKLRALLPHDAATRKLTHLVEARRKLVDRRTQLSNELTSLLKNYYPQALELTGENRSAPLALSFLERWPELALLQAARPRTVRDFYHAHRVRRPELIAGRLALIERARPLTTDRALCEVSILELRALVAELRVLEKHRARLEEEIATAFAAHPEAALFQSLPGAGAALAPRLSVLFGTDRARWLHPGELQTYFGIAPVIQKSGRSKTVHWRWSAPWFGRQTLMEWAGLSAQYSTWAKAYYQQQKEKEKGHGAILRSLAFKWLRILWRCWQNHEPYDEARYLAQLKLRNPSLSARLATA
jgi:transposase